MVKKWLPGRISDRYIGIEDTPKNKCRKLVILPSAVSLIVLVAQAAFYENSPLETFGRVVLSEIGVELGHSESRLNLDDRIELYINDPGLEKPYIPGREQAYHYGMPNPGEGGIIFHFYVKTEPRWDDIRLIVDGRDVEYKMLDENTGTATFGDFLLKERYDVRLDVYWNEKKDAVDVQVIKDE